MSVGVEKFFSTPTLSIKKCIEEHHRKKEVLLDAKYETDAGTVVLDNLEYVTKDEETGEEVVHHCKLIRAEDPGHLKRATKYASMNSHVCVGDDTQSYGKKLNLPTNQNGIEIYFLWEDDGSEGGIYHQIISYNKKNKSIEQMKGVDNEMVKNDDAYFPALLEALKALNREKGGLRKVEDTANLRVRENYVLTDEGEVPFVEVDRDRKEIVTNTEDIEKRNLILKKGEFNLWKFLEKTKDKELTIKEVNKYIKQKNIPLPFEITKREEIALAKEEIDENTRYYRGDLKPEDVEIFKKMKGPIYIEGDVDMQGTDITEIPKGIHFGDYAYFEQCTSLATISEGVSFGGFVSFAGCTSLTRISEMVLFKGNVYFIGCTSLTIISEKVSFGWSANFEGCTSLAKETIEKLKRWKAEGKIPGTLWLPDGTKIK